MMVTDNHHSQNYSNNKKKLEKKLETETIQLPRSCILDRSLIQLMRQSGLFSG